MAGADTGVHSNAIARLRSGAVADIADILDRIGCPDRALAPRIAPLAAGMRCTGRALCVEGSPCRPGEDAHDPGLYRAIDDAVRADDVLVIAAHGYTASAVFGGSRALRLKERGCTGVIIDGALRDAEELCGLGGAYFSRGTAVRSFIGRWRFRRIGGPVTVAAAAGGEIDICDGDVICADRDGILAIPAALADLVLRELDAQS